MTDVLSTARAEPRLLATRWWHRLRRPLTRHRAVFMALSRRRPSRHNLLVRPESVLTIEAPMRSGNTFAVAAFWLSNGQGGHVARHVHAAAHVLEATRLGVPVLVIVRDPRAVAVSHVLRRPALTVRDSLIDYSVFFETLEPIRSKIVSASFEEVTEHFDQVIARLNASFETTFACPTIDDGFQAEVMELIEEMNRHEDGGEVDEMRVARPSPERDRAREEPESALTDPRLRRHLARAMAVYERWR